jgi:hypothetical protein
MRQERITRKPRRRTTRQHEVTPQDLPRSVTDVTEADEVLAQIEQLIEQLAEVA